MVSRLARSAVDESGTWGEARKTQAGGKIPPIRGASRSAMRARARVRAAGDEFEVTDIRVARELVAWAKVEIVAP